MQLEDLQRHWQRLDQKLDMSLAFESELVRQLIVQPARRRVNRLAVWPAIDVAFCVCGLLFCGPYLHEHWRDGRLLLPVSIVMLGFLALLIDSILQLERVSSLDWDGPVAEIQGALERLRIAKIRQFKWIILLSPLIGFCGLLVGVQWIISSLTENRVDILDRLHPGWIVGNYAFGVLFIPLGWLAARFLAGRCSNHSWWKSVLDGISGTTLKSAKRDLERWANLQRDPARNGE